jgi:hypothetical protein
LTAGEACRRLAEVGPNEPARAPRTAGLVQILLLLAKPLVVVVAPSIGLNFVRTYRSHGVDNVIDHQERRGVSNGRGVYTPRPPRVIEIATTRSGGNSGDPENGRVD